MAVELDEHTRKALEEAHYWTLATVNSDGSPQVSTLWVDLRDGKILVNTALGRKKPRNIHRDPRVALNWYDPNNPYATIAIQGRVVESYAGERADADINALSHKYMGKDHPFREGEQRITYLIEPRHVHSQH